MATQKSVHIKSAQRLRAEAGRKAAASGEATNPLEAQYRTQKDAAKTEKASRVAEEPRKAKKATTAKPKGERKPGILTLAADVLKDAKAPMDCKTIVEKVLAKGLWHAKGKTPAATLYTAVTMLGKAA